MLQALGAKKIRVQLELEFRDVNLFLKSNGRKLLDNISGVLRPGRVTAVMVRFGLTEFIFRFLQSFMVVKLMRDSSVRGPPPVCSVDACRWCFKFLQAERDWA